jgi:hypothetical protein
MEELAYFHMCEPGSSNASHGSCVCARVCVLVLYSFYNFQINSCYFPVANVSAS